MGSSSKSKSSSQSVTNTQNLNQQGVYGTALAGLDNSNVNFMTTDHDSVKEAFGLGSRALDMAGAVSTDALGHLATQNTKSIEFLGDTTQGAFNLSNSAMDRIDQANRAAMGGAFSLSNSAMERIDDAHRSAMSGAQAATENALAFAMNSTKADQGQNAEMMKYTLIAAAAIVGLAAFGGRR